MPRSHNAELDLFLNALFPWDANGQKLFKSVSWTFPLKPGEPLRPGMKPGQKPMANYAADTYDRLVQLIEGRRLRPDTDLYICLGTQRLANIQKFTNDGFPKAVRRQDNIASYSSIWMDLDVKPGAYATTDEAYEALDAFIDAVGLPPASVEVLSGSGGVHVYWCVKEPMPPQTWLPLAKALRDSATAHGMHFDALVTVTPTALLRIPGSFNWKRQPPMQVRLLMDSSFELYDYAELATPLQAAVAATVTNVNIGAGTGTAGKTTYNQNFTANLNSSPPVTVDDVADACLVIKDILDRGGNGDAEPLWNHALLLASFTSNPSDAAHRLSKGDRRYSAAETDKKLAEKEAAKAANPNIGWPQCDQFNALTQKCHACIYFHNHKSPLSYASKVQPINPQQTVRPNDDLMPPGFWRDKDDHVLTYIKDKDDNTHIHDVLNHPIHDAGVDEASGRLVFQTTSGGARKWCDMAVSQATQPAEAGRTLAGETVRIFIQPAFYAKARDFLVAWMDHLQKVKKTIAPAHYGWTDDFDGFTFDQTTYTAGGEDVAYRGKTHDPRFAQRGELKPWQEAMALVYGNAPLETAVASSFAAPLVSLVAGFSVVVSVCSPHSGVGKTTALQLAQAVWGNPRTGMSATEDSVNSVMKKISDLSSLPAYWDELKTVDQLERIIGLVFSITQGKGKSRLTRDIKQAETNAFTTMFVVASNHGIQDTVYRDTTGTDAGGLRIFEVGIDDLKTTISSWHAAQLMKRIEINYGCAGAQYARYLAAHRDECIKLLDTLTDRYEKIFKFTAKERFWRTTMVTLLAGAMIAQQAKIATFDIGGIDRYLQQSFDEQRSTLLVHDYATLNTSTSALGLMQELAAELRGKHLITTNVINYAGQKGRPTKVDIVDMADILPRLTDVWMQIGRNDGRIRLRVRPFYDWLHDRRINPRHVKKLLEQDYVVTQSKQSIGVGVPTLDALTHVLGGRSECIDLTPRNPGSTPGASST
jgi:hypothetical protein